MSFGALSLEAKMALAKGASMAGTATCSGEGGMIPPERDLSTKWYYQVIQSRYGFNPHHLMLADGVEFFIGQGCKVGLGGHLMGQKVTEQVAEMRSLPAGIDQRSPARHPDWLGQMALAKGASMAGSATCSGEGGMIPPERDLSTKWYYQCIQSRYGFNPHHLMLADAVEFFIGQGCKVGLGGHLMGQKVTEQVAEMRSLPAGIDQRSPARHPDWLGPDDLSLKIQEVREATNYEIPIQLKLGAARVYDDVRMAAKCGPDIIYLDGAEGGTGAGPHIATEETGIPLMAAIPEARRALEDVGLADSVDLVVAGGIRNGGDTSR